ncbi:unnamed protein product, partial [Iphiclides podalirius]
MTRTRSGMTRMGRTLNELAKDSVTSALPRHILIGHLTNDEMRSGSDVAAVGGEAAAGATGEPDTKIDVAGRDRHLGGFCGAFPGGAAGAQRATSVLHCHQPRPRLDPSP